MTSSVSTDLYRAARHAAAWLDRRRGRIVVSGKDRATYLQGLFSNDILALVPGSGCYATYLTPQGRMITDVWVHELGDVILLQTELAQKETLLSRLDRFIFSEDVQLGDVTDAFAGVGIVGPRAATVLAQALQSISVDALDAMTPHAAMRVTFEGEPAIVIRQVDVGEPGFDVLVTPSLKPALQHQLTGVVELDEELSEVLRVEGGVPRFGRDMDEETIPLEAGLEETAISSTKGCYVGQEVIIRVLHRGHGRVVRKLVGLRLARGEEGTAVPAAGAPVRAGDRDAGVVTSSVFSIALDQPIALAYLHRDFVERGTEVTVDGSPAVVATLPFVPAGT